MSRGTESARCRPLATTRELMLPGGWRRDGEISVTHPPSTRRWRAQGGRLPAADRRPTHGAADERSQLLAQHRGHSRGVDAAAAVRRLQLAADGLLGDLRTASAILSPRPMWVSP